MHMHNLRYKQALFQDEPVHQRLTAKTWNPARCSGIPQHFVSIYTS